MNDLSLILKIKEDQDGESIKTLVDRHSGIYIDIVNRFIPKDDEDVKKSDFLEDKNYSIYSAALKFDPLRETKFSTFLANETRWRCLNSFNAKKKMMLEPFEFSSAKDESCEDFTEGLQNSEIIHRILYLASKNKDKRVKKIIDMRYFSDYNIMPWREIANNLNLSVQRCIDIHNQFIKQIKDQINA